MATAITDSSITGIVAGAYGDLVKLDDDRVVDLATYLKETDDGGTDNIVGIIKGAYDSQVLLSDGSVKSLADHVRAPGALTIAGIITGAYTNQAKIADGMIVNLAEKVKADEGGGSALEVGLSLVGGIGDPVQIIDAKMIDYNGNEYLVEKLENGTFVVSKQLEEGRLEPISDRAPLVNAVLKLYRESFSDPQNLNADELA